MTAGCPCRLGIRISSANVAVNEAGCNCRIPSMIHKIPRIDIMVFATRSSLFKSLKKRALVNELELCGGTTSGATKSPIQQLIEADLEGAPNHSSRQPNVRTIGVSVDCYLQTIRNEEHRKCVHPYEDCQSPAHCGKQDTIYRYQRGDELCHHDR